MEKSPALKLHEKLRGKLTVNSKIPVKTMEDLSLLYTPGVAEPCLEIASSPKKVFDYTMKGNTVAIVTDGSSVLGLGNIGAEASLPVMEGKALLLKEFAGVDAFPIALKTQNVDEIVFIVKNISPVFGGINLEDISAPRCFEVEEKLQNIGIPVMHDDQHGTAIVVLAALINSAKALGKDLARLKVVINGAGAAGTAIANFLVCFGDSNLNVCTSVRDVIVCDSKGIIHKSRTDMDDYKLKLAEISNRENKKGSLADALKGADVFIGVSKGNIVTEEMIRSMAKDSIVFAMANPVPEIMPDIAKKAGAKIVATGRSDFPNQVNNALAFPGVFRGLLDSKASRVTNNMKIRAAYALANTISNPTIEKILPNVFDKNVVKNVARAIAESK
ncbi:MAG TPA: NADP-dependent malic enzyme [archaeon]|nr:NADP-dependent malic enzyme [archaeon]